MHCCCSLLSKISSLLGAWLRLLMSTYVGMPVSWIVWQIIFTASFTDFFLLVSFFFFFPLSSISASDYALFCQKAFLSGLPPELPLRYFSIFSTSHTHIFPSLLSSSGIFYLKMKQLIAHIIDRRNTASLNIKPPF